MSHFTIFPSPLADWSPFAYYKEMFSSEECEKIKALFKDGFDGRVGAGAGELNKEIRSSELSFFGWSQETAWIYDRLYRFIHACNVSRYNFSIAGFYEQMQLTHYKKAGDHYGWHQDIGHGALSVRKLSAVIQLSNPKDYTGGKLEFAGYKDNIPSDQGDLILFPSYMSHRVTPLTKGERWSLVVWVSGEPYR